MHSNSIGRPKIFPLSAPVLYWLSHLTRISSLKVKNDRKTLVFDTAKNIQIQPTLFRYFLDEFLETDLRPIYCSLTACKATICCCHSLARPRRHYLDPSEKSSVSKEGGTVLSPLSGRNACTNWQRSNCLW